MKRTKIVSAVAALVAAASLAACGVSTSDTTAAAGQSVVQAADGSTTSGTSGTSATTASLTDNVASHAEADDADYTASEAVTVTLADGASKASSSTGVSVDGDTVAISSPGTYVLSGTLSDGQVVVDSDAEGTVRIVLDNASISSSSASPFVIKAADEAVVVLADGTTNSLTDGASYGDDSSTDDPNATLYSMADLTITGTGSLAVKGNSNDGIASKDGLVIQSGTIAVVAADDGIRGKDYAIVEGGTIAVQAGGDAIKSDNETDDTVGYVSISGGSVTLAAGDDGIHAEGDLAVSGGTLTVKQSNEGIEGATITLSGGTNTITASDDAVNVSMGTATTSDQAGQDGQDGQGGQGGPGGGGMQDQTSQGAVLTISGGTNVITSEGDGLDSNGSIVVTGGTTVVNGPTMNGNGALDSNGGITVAGGTVVAAGSSGMAEAPETDSESGWVSVTFSSPVAAGETISIVSGDAVVASFTTAKETASLVVAADGITSGDSYDVYVGGSLASGPTGSYSAGGSIDGASKVTTVTAGEHTASRGGMGGQR